MCVNMFTVIASGSRFKMWQVMLRETISWFVETEEDMMFRRMVFDKHVFVGPGTKLGWSLFFPNVTKLSMEDCRVVLWVCVTFVSALCRSVFERFSIELVRPIRVVYATEIERGKLFVSGNTSATT